ncbi:MAG: hypothetical protein V1783_04250, partial [Bacteroidota bacterium]
MTKSRLTLLQQDHSHKRLIKDKLVLALVIALSLVTISPIVLIISKLLIKGYRQISLDFIIKNT